MLTVNEVIKAHKLEVIAGSKGLERVIEKQQVTRPGLELAGLFDFYEFDRIQILGSKEVHFFGWLQPDERETRTRMLFEKKPPMFVFSVNAEIPQIFIDLGNEYNVTVCKSKKKTSAVTSSMFMYLSSKLADRLTLHGTLLDVSGVGVLIRGKSGLGKSEVALELVRRGHQLVADDRVDIYQREQGILVGEAPEILKKYLEIRGIGIVNVVSLFGVKAYKENKKIMLVIDLELWNDEFTYDRLGIEDEKITFFDSEISYIKIPVSEGRNIASLVEAAAMNSRLKYLGTNSALEFSNELDQLLKQNKE